MIASGSKGVNHPIDALTGELQLWELLCCPLIMAAFPWVDFMAISTPINMLEPNRLYLPWMRRPQGPWASQASAKPHSS